MRNLIQTLFYSPKYGKIDDKTMMARVVTSVITVIFCLAAMGFAAYAYFSHDVDSGSNTLKAAKFETTISIEVKDENGTVIETVTPITSNYKTFIADLKAGKTYTVTVQPTQQSTAKTGFLIVTAKNCSSVYHTQQIGIDTNAEGGKTSAVTFQLTLTQDDEVRFLAHWGTSNHYADYQDAGLNGELYVTQGETVELMIAPPTSGTSQEEPPATEVTQPETEAATEATSGETSQPTDETTANTEATE